MKRGKSTLLNALLGEALLPSAVNPCTAVLTILRFGQQKQVTVYFNNGQEPSCLSFDDFKRQYTIDPREAKRLESEKRQAFPHIDYAIVECPLPLLKNGVEVVDSPGLNDTEERNKLTLGYINSCHAILFVMSATQPCTKEERRYLENYIKDRGLPIFFLINRWDELRHQVLNPDDPEEVTQAEEAQRQVFEANLSEYCQVEGSDLYDERVFEVSAKHALRKRLNGEELDGTGFPEFMGSLNNFLIGERAISEFRQSRVLLRQVHGRVHKAVELRIPLLAQDVTELKQRIMSVEPEFQKLTEIRHAFKDEIISTRDCRADTISQSLQTYISNLDTTFEADFAPYQPDLNFWTFLRKGKRQEFIDVLQSGFKQYVNDKISNWSHTAEGEIKEAFLQMAVSANQYGASYSQVTDRISSKLTGCDISVSAEASSEDKSPGWARWAAGGVALLMGDIVGAGMASVGIFNWKSILLNIGIIVGVNAAMIAAFHTLLGPLGILLTATVAGGMQANSARKKLVQTLKEEMKKHLPEIASKQSAAVRQEVKKMFNEYGAEVSKRMNDDINSRKAELNKLVEQKQQHEINREAEIARLRRLDNYMSSEWHKIEAVWDQTIKQA